MSYFFSYDEFLMTLKSIQAPAGDCSIELCKHDTIRFGELKKALPQITNTMLTSTLRELETYELVDRIQYNEIPPHVEYSLTEKGRDLIPIYYEIYK